MSTPYIIGDLARGTVVSGDADYYDEYGVPTQMEAAFPTHRKTRRQGTLRIKVACDEAVGVGILDVASGAVEWLDDGDPLVPGCTRQWDQAVKGEYEFNVVFTATATVRVLYCDCIER